MFSKLGVLQILTFILLSELWPESCADVFSAMFKMEHLLETRQRVIHDLDAYIDKEENRLRDLKMYLKMYKTEHERAMKDMTHYTGNPINAFILIKRLTSDLDDLEERINKPTEFVSVRNVTRDSSNATILYPTAVDLQGAALALKRLQKTYKLKVEDLANGVLNGVVYSDNRNVSIGQPMTVSDCHKIGVIMFKKKDYMNALAWQMEALRKFKLEDSIPHSLTKIHIMEYIGIVYHHISDTQTALEWTTKILALDPDNKIAKKNLLVYERILGNDGGLEEVSEPKNHDEDAKPEAENGDQIDFDAAEEEKNKEDEKVSLKTTTDINNSTDSEKKAEFDQNTDEKTEDNAENENKIDAKNYGDKNINSDSEISDSQIADAVTEKGSDAKSENGSGNDTGIKAGTDAKDDEFNIGIETLNILIDYRKDHLIYEALCRGEYDVAPEISSRLTCRYLNDKPFLKLAPIKAEQRYIDPDVFLFHDVISDEEIAHVQKISKPQFKRALVGTVHDNSSTVAEYRISQSAWLDDDEDDVAARLSQRISDFTGLDMKYAEALQVANYGVGGHYEPHFDYIGTTSSLSGPLSLERIATAMFYMSDVTQGGATVFPKLGLTVFPVKGSAVFWMNLLPSGEGNQNTRHAACPVLEGSKWVSNKWISLWGQEFIKPCNLEYQRETVILQQPAPVPKPESLVETNS